ncbi:MAG: class I SAM-dependent methyltransferase, partial [bacterium]|nr:class I SAM-dependent methyltransferase [bacterium]
MATFLAVALLLIALIVALSVGAVACVTLWSVAVADAPWVPLSRKGIDAVLNSLGTLPAGTVVVDLGCGDGRVLRAIARRHPAIRGVGIEQSHLLTMFARWWSTLLGFSQLRFERGNFLHRSLADADVVTCYLWPDVMPRLGEKFQRELRPGSRVVVVAFPIPDWHPDHTGVISRGGRLFVYRMG